MVVPPLATVPVIGATLSSTLVIEGAVFRVVKGLVDHTTRHGFGYSVFEHAECGIHSELTVFVAMDAAVKFSVLKVRNDGARARRLSATGYVEWVLARTNGDKARN